MEFKNKEIMKIILSNLDKIGQGSQGVCYHNKRTNEVYKIYHQAFDYNPDDYINYTSEELLRFSHIKNKSFIWPKEVIYLNGKVIGSVTKFVKAKSLYKMNPLKLNLSKFIDCIKEVKKDINTLSNSGVITYDLMYNILYGNRFYVSDYDEFSYSDKSFDILKKENNINFNYELYYFLIEGYFDEFINNYKILKKLYQEKDQDIIMFIKLLRKYLSEYLDKEINTLNEATKCLNKTKLDNYNYQRNYII